jgi:hypothetical protein
MGVVFREGNMIGATRTSSLSAGNGIWNIYEIENRNRRNQWPVQIVGDGLQMNMDAGIPESYAGSGSTWNDLSGNNRHVTLVNSPSYSSNNGGFLSFNGTNQSANRTYENIGTNNFSLDVWARPTATITVNAQATSGTTGLTGQRYLLFPAQSATNGGAGISLGTNGLSVYEHGNAYLAPLLSHAVAISNTIFTNIVIVYTNKLPSLYINNVFIKNGFTSLRASVFYNSGEFIAGQYGLFSGAVSSVKIYNKSLSASEISQNFNALRNRYGV